MEDSVRRGRRIRQKPKQYKEFDNFYEKINNRQTNLNKSGESDCSESDEEITGHVQTSEFLFTNDDVEGGTLFKFQPSTKFIGNLKGSLLTPKTRLVKLNVESTPKNIKSVIKKKIIKDLASDNSTESDFSASGSDFVPDEQTDESSASLSDDCEGQSESDEQIKLKFSKTRPNKYINSLQNIRKIKTKRDAEYIIKSDDYFNMNSVKKITTSDHTLERLKNNNLSNLADFDADVSQEHKYSIQELCNSYQCLFDKWLYLLHENYSVLLYGIGSKRNILHTFKNEKLNNSPCVIVNGFFPSLTLKCIYESIIVDLFECSQTPSSTSECIELIKKKIIEFNTILYLIIHNIDGPMLRNSKTQTALANLSTVDNIYVIATIDHINAPLVWDQSKLSKYNFIWFDVTTMQTYKAETSYENSILSRNPGALQLSSLTNVYHSLTTNAKGIFSMIIKHQIKHEKLAQYPGLPFKVLYSMAREQFLVSSDIALRAQLTEFLDHKLIKMKRSVDGSDNLKIPIENHLLQQFIDQQEA